MTLPSISNSDPNYYYDPAGNLAWAAGHSYTYDAKNRSGVKFVNKSTGWISDASDHIMRTTNGGHSWTLHRAPTKALWYTMHLTNDSNGWILGAEGRVLRTANGGKDWSLSQVGGSDQLFSLSFADENNGWVVGEHGVAYESIDAGAHWRPRGIDLKELLPNQNESIIDFRVVKFVDSKVGFIAADVLSKSGEFNARAFLFKTKDGGRTWSATLIPELLGVKSAEFISETDGWIIPGGRSQTFILRTQDGGETWSKIRFPRNGDPRRVFFVDSTHGWFLNQSDTFDSDLLFRTNDGGTSWSQVNIGERLIAR